MLSMTASALAAFRRAVLAKVRKSLAFSRSSLPLSLRAIWSCFRPGNIRVVTASYSGAMRTERKASWPGSAIFRTAKFFEMHVPVGDRPGEQGAFENYPDIIVGYGRYRAHCTDDPLHCAVVFREAGKSRPSTNPQALACACHSRRDGYRSARPGELVAFPSGIATSAVDGASRPAAVPIASASHSMSGNAS